MSHLIVMTLGPVQDFIMRARRTRDLWFGSFLLSEMSKAVALALQDCGYSLIFPNAPDQASLATLLKPCRDKKMLTLAPSISNVVLAMGGESAGAPEIAAQKARAAADACWQGWAKQAHQACQGLLRPNSSWDAQIKDALEFYAV
ncbi:MAG: hypothetical protein ORN21_02145, partial [Methylophilaceae bacterium]|nr:hypothetical protein [Methylophilaceae bacterium]